MEKDRKNVETAKLGYKRFTEHYKKKLEIIFERRARRYTEIYNHWLQELGPDTLPPLTESWEVIVESIGFDEVFGSIPPTMRDLEDSPLLSESAIAHLLFAGSNIPIKSIVVNRRLARLDSGLLVFAPPSAKLGDIVCFLESPLASDEFHPDFHDVPFVLRPEPSRKNSKVDADILDSDRGKLNRPLVGRHQMYKLGHESWHKSRPLTPRQSSLISGGGDEGSGIRELQNFQGAKIEHFTFVGEAFVDGMMLGRGRSKLYHGDWESMVFAIH